MNTRISNFRKQSLFKNAIEIYNCHPLDKNRKKFTVFSRAAISAILKKEGYSCQFIGNFLNINYTTVIHHLKHHQDNLDFDKEYKMLFEQFKSTCSIKKLKKIDLLDNVESNLKEALLCLKDIGYNEEQSENYLLSSIRTLQSQTA